MFRICFCLLVLMAFSCGTTSEENNYDLEGTWQAQWRTLPESFEGIADITSFEMDGQFIFREDSLTVVANGYPGCVFGIDTIRHTQRWQVSNDSIHLINDNNVRGISYQITNMTDSQIDLKLMEDIFLKLERHSEP